MVSWCDFTFCFLEKIEHLSVFIFTILASSSLNTYLCLLPIFLLHPFLLICRSSLLICSIDSLLDIRVANIYVSLDHIAIILRYYENDLVMQPMGQYFPNSNPFQKSSNDKVF